MNDARADGESEQAIEATVAALKPELVKAKRWLVDTY